MGLCYRRKEKDNRTFECNICLDTAKDAVISMCGHLFCWPCLHQWLETRPIKQTCPVCKAAISKDKVIPLYGRGATKHEDPRNNVPPLLLDRGQNQKIMLDFLVLGLEMVLTCLLVLEHFLLHFFTSTFNFWRNTTKCSC